MRTHAHRPRQLTRSTDCVKFVATREFLITLPSMEPLAVARQQGVRTKNFYTAYQTPGCAIAVPADSPIHKLTDLKGKTIGVTNMASAGVIIVRALAAASGLNPDTDINLVVAGEGAQPAALLRSKQVDALSQFDTQYALIENASVKLRILDKRPIERFPSNGFIALEDTIHTRARELIGFARAYAKGTNEANLREYMEFLQKWGVLKQRVDVTELMTNELIGEINRFDADAITKAAREYRPR